MPIDINGTQFSLKEYENKECLLLLTFNSDVAWQLGNLARDQVLKNPYLNKKAVIDVSLTNGHILFHAPATPGTTVENDSWIETMKNTVKRTGESSLYNYYKTIDCLHVYYSDVRSVGQAKYASYGGSIPIRVKGLDYIVGMLTISGDHHIRDHIMAYNALEEFPK